MTSLKDALLRAGLLPTPPKPDIQFRVCKYCGREYVVGSGCWCQRNENTQHTVLRKRGRRK